MAFPFTKVAVGASYHHPACEVNGKTSGLHARLREEMQHGSLSELAENNHSSVELIIETASRRAAGKPCCFAGVCFPFRSKRGVSGYVPSDGISSSIQQWFHMRKVPGRDQPWSAQFRDSQSLTKSQLAELFANHGADLFTGHRRDIRLFLIRGDGHFLESQTNVAIMQVPVFLLCMVKGSFSRQVPSADLLPYRSTITPSLDYYQPLHNAGV